MNRRALFPERVAFRAASEDMHRLRTYASHVGKFPQEVLRELVKTVPEVRGEQEMQAQTKEPRHA